MSDKENLIKNIELNKRKDHLYSILKISAAFFIIALFSSWNGFTHITTDLTFLSDNLFLANILFIGFVVSVNERIIEVFTSTFRRRTKNEFANEFSNAKKSLAITPDDVSAQLKVKLWESINNDYSTETGRFCLVISLVIGCSLSCLGAFRVLGSLVDYSQFANAYHIALFDAVDVVLAGFIIGGGSQGWTDILTSTKSIMTKK
jgi:hypothetical protein